MLTPDQIIATQKANLDSANNMALKAFEGVEKLVQLNLDTAKSSITESYERAQALLSVKDAQELLAVQSEMAQPIAEKVAQYNREVYEIYSAASAEINKALEAKVAENRAQFADFVDNAIKNAPAGSDAAAAMMKNAVAAANNAYDTVQKVAKQATDMAEESFNAAAANATNVAKSAATTARKKS